MKTLEELYYDDVTEVWLYAYGYTEISIFNIAYKQFKRARIVRFTIERNPWNSLTLYNRKFWVDLDFYVRPDDTFILCEDNRWVSTRYYSLECKASND